MTHYTTSRSMYSIKIICKDMKKICIGIDVSKETLDVTVIHIESYELVEKLGYSKFDNRPSGFRSMTAWGKESH